MKLEQMKCGFWWACAACVFALLPIGASAEQPLRLMTYNIRYMNSSDGLDVWANRSSAVISTIELADVVGLQEVVLQQFEDIQAATENEFEWYGRGRDDGEKQGEMTPIGWRKSLYECSERGTFWLSEHPDKVGEKSWDAALPRIASWVKLRRLADDQELLVVNTHFDHRGQEARRQSARLLRKWTAQNRQGLPAILMGDLNAELKDAPLEELLEPSKQDAAQLSDAMAATTTPATGPNSTWNGFQAIAEGRRIDHILFVGDVNVSEFKTLDPRTEKDRFASDHLPVMITASY